MEIWLLLILLALMTYFTVKQSVAGITQTPIWLLSLVLMIPAILWSIWLLVKEQNQNLDTSAEVIAGLVIMFSFLGSLRLYWLLVQRGRFKPEVKNESLSPPSTLIDPELNQAEKSKIRPISSNEEKALRDCFPWGIFYLQNIDYYPQAILCRGKLRTVPEIAYQTIKTNVEQLFGDRFLVVFQESLQGQPFFALVANPWMKNQQIINDPLFRPFLAAALLIITLFTTTIAGAEFAGVTVQQIEQDSHLLLQGLPYSLALIVILGCHEFSHYLTSVYYRIKTTLPYFIPVPFFLGTLGAFVQMRSPIPHRKALFDVAIAGPLGGLIVTIPLLIWGFSVSEIVPLAEKSSLFSIEALNPRFSFLLSVLAKIGLGASLNQQSAIALHPLAVAGYIGLIMTALNLMPVGQLDGGHIVHAMFGQKGAIMIAQVTRLLMIILAIIEPGFLIWAIILLFMPVTDQPALNDVTQLDNKRDFLGLMTLFLLAIILLPLPGAIAQWLQI